MTVMMDSVPGIRSAPPTPWRTRATISWPVVCESPQSSELNVKIASPIWNIFLRPNLSPRIPPVSRNDAKAST